MAIVTRYQDRFLKVLQYIDLHVDEVLTLEKLSNVAHLSRFHFHRQFSAYMGLTVSSYIRRLRLKRAAYQLVYRRNMKVIDIALASGFESSEAFSRAFKSSTGQGPREFRNTPEWMSWLQKQSLPEKLRKFRMQKDDTDIEVSTTQFEEVRVAVLEHRGPHELLGESIRKFIEWRKEARLPPSKSRTFNLVYDDPSLTSPEDYRFDLCAATNTSIDANKFGVIEKVIPAGRCAVHRFVGSDDGLELAIDYMYSQWLDDSGQQVRDFPLFFERISFFPDVAEHEWVTDIYLPLL